MTLKLIIGNKNYSSWSMRPWLAMKVARIAFEEEVVSLDAGDFKSRVGAVSDSGKVPALADDDTHIWESLAILEYLAEKFPQAELWPHDPAARAEARAIAAEMHAGFAPMRRHLPMNSPPRRTRTSSASMPSGLDVAPGLRARALSCSGGSGRRTPCTRRWLRASIPMMSQLGP